MEDAGGGGSKARERPRDNGGDDEPEGDKSPVAAPADKYTLTSSQGVAHRLGVEEILECDPNQPSPNYPKPVLRNKIRPEDKLAATEGQPEQYKRGAEGVPEARGAGQISR